MIIFSNPIIPLIKPFYSILSSSKNTKKNITNNLTTKKKPQNLFINSSIHFLSFLKKSSSSFSIHTTSYILQTLKKSIKNQKQYISYSSTTNFFTKFLFSSLIIYITLPPNPLKNPSKKYFPHLLSFLNFSSSS